MEPSEDTRCIIENITKKYAALGVDLPAHTLETLVENIESGICLICIEDVERHESVWSCSKCYCVLHLVCIQKWANDRIRHLREDSISKGFSIRIEWCCPKCRESYGENEFPDTYRCFCGKVKNPPNDPWISPHTCGEVCGQALQPLCSHNCVLLCHSGPCPPCPKTVSITCYCGKSNPRTLRCSSKYWSCGKVCNKTLPCNLHLCHSTCHESECPPCGEKVKVYCRCSSPKEILYTCSELQKSEVTCGERCDKVLNCKVHKCELVCHDSDCPPCEQSCPCGKSRVACSGQKNRASGRPCEDTCNKLLDCEKHRCQQKCHIGTCGSCLEYVLKKCSCGSQEKQVLCSKEFICTTKCKRIRNCTVHPCNRKCCTGSCPPCRVQCGKTLGCKNHKCENICHRGQCYPCPITIEVKCRCGRSVRVVPCGSEKKCKPPPCKELCNKPSRCYHASIQKHICHFGDCPKCTLICAQKLSCGHECPTRCHTLKRIKHPNESNKPCPPCLQLVGSKCPLHSDVLVKCHERAKPCREICSKQLECGAHACEKICHVGSSCGECTNPCNKPRPEGCKHQCTRGCHKGPCADCNLVAKLSCHCGSEEILTECYKQNIISETERSCKNQCPRKLTCGHRCLSICHSGSCPILDRCRRKVRVVCRCRQFKKDLDCFMVESKILECTTDTCVKAELSPGVSASHKKRSKKNARKSETLINHANNNAKEEEENVVTEDSGKSSNLYKYIFIVTLGLFLGVIYQLAFI